MFIFRLILKPAPKTRPDHHCVHSRFTANGWTLIELISVLAILMLLTGIGVPSFSKWLQRTSESTVFNTLHHLCNLARTRAIKDNSYYTLCPSSDLKNCNGSWNHTIIVFNDPNKNETVDGNETLFKAVTLPTTTPCLHWNAGAQRQYLQFKPSGATNGTAGHFAFCDTANSLYENKLVVSFAGRTALKSR